MLDVRPMVTKWHLVKKHVLVDKQNHIHHGLIRLNSKQMSGDMNMRQWTVIIGTGVTTLLNTWPNAALL